jgi:hypothetical protein
MRYAFTIKKKSFHLDKIPSRGRSVSGGENVPPRFARGSNGKDACDRWGE